MEAPSYPIDPFKVAPLFRPSTGNNIPRKIHYIWFGGSPLPDRMKARIEGWSRLMPRHEIIEWNEGNFDVTAHPWMERMHDEGRYAFASDYARLCILQQHGGLYLDTDVELKKDLSPFFTERCFWSFEFDSFLSTCIIGVVPGHPLLASLREQYDQLKDGVINNELVTKYFLRNYPEFKLDNSDQRVGGDIRILPKEYFIVPSFDKGKNFGVHHAENHWNEAPNGIGLGGLVRGIVGDVFFFKLVNLRMNWKSEFRAMDRARQRA